MERGMEDSWMEDSRHAFLLQVRETFVGLKESSNQTSRLSIPGNCIVLVWVLTYCLISTVYKHKYLRDIKLLLAVGFARFESFSSEIWLARPVQSSGEFHYQSGLSSQISLFKNMIWLFGKCPKITTFLSTARNIWKYCEGSTSKSARMSCKSNVIFRDYLTGRIFSIFVSCGNRWEIKVRH